LIGRLDRKSQSSSTLGAKTMEHTKELLSIDLSKLVPSPHNVRLQAELCRQPALALAVLTHVFVQRVFGAEYPRHTSALQVTPQTSTFALEAAADDLKAGPAWSAVQATQEASRAQLPQKQGGWLSWLIAMPQTDLVELLTLCTALTVNALPCANVGADANAIASAAGLNMAEWWQPTAQAFLNHVPKAQIIQALKEAGPDPAGDELAAMKKDALVTLAASRLAGTRWLPEPLRAAQE
jgi:ParB family transcriptional regulator, chromosome partitioning protein